MQRLYWTTLPPLLASVAALARWLMQGSGNVYTDFGKDFYIPDRDLGWRLTDSSATWLGLDAVLITAAIALAVAVGVFVLRRFERSRGAPMSWLRRALAGVGVAALAVPGWAFASGFGPPGAKDQLPGQDFVATRNAGVTGSLPSLPSGNYTLRSHEGTQMTASIKAGGETFEARFTGTPQGFLRLDPGNLSQPMQAEFSVASPSVDTGIELRSKHAREELQSEVHPRIEFSLVRVLSSAQAGARSLSFAAQGQLRLVGKAMPVEVVGTLSAPDDAGKTRLGYPGEDILLVKANFTISLQESAIENDGTFDEDSIPIQVSLVLVRATKKQKVEKSI